MVLFRLHGRQRLSSMLCLDAHLFSFRNYGSLGDLGASPDLELEFLLLLSNSLLLHVEFSFDLGLLGLCICEVF